MMATPYPAEIIQLPEQKRIIMIFEGATHIWREISMDGRPHPEGDALNPTYLGHSVGHWEGDTLVVDTVGFAPDRGVTSIPGGRSRRNRDTGAGYHRDESTATLKCRRVQDQLCATRCPLPGSEND